MTVLQVIGAGILWMVCVAAAAVVSLAPEQPIESRGRDAVRGALWGAVFATFVAAIVLGFALLLGGKP